jgi:hypothetical protein
VDVDVDGTNVWMSVCEEGVELDKEPRFAQLARCLLFGDVNGFSDLERYKVDASW